jgi:hypothetical protein
LRLTTSNWPSSRNTGVSEVIWTMLEKTWPRIQNQSKGYATFLMLLAIYSSSSKVNRVGTNVQTCRTKNSSSIFNCHSTRSSNSAGPDSSLRPLTRVHKITTPKSDLFFTKGRVLRQQMCPSESSDWEIISWRILGQGTRQSTRLNRLPLLPKTWSNTPWHQNIFLKEEFRSA